MPLILIAFGVILYMLNAIYMQINKGGERSQKINVAENLYNYSKKEAEVSKQDLLISITKYYGKNVSDRICQGEIWVNMDIELLIASLGKSSEIKDSYVKGNRIERWYYYPYYNRLNNLKYKFEITIENDLITGWKDLI